MKYRTEIDGLRTIAIVPVILFHAGIPGFSGGFVGVDIFFVISGFLVSKIIYEEIIIGNFSIATFYERRVRRILPALFFVSLVCIPFAWIWMLPNEFIFFAKTLVAVNLFSSNIFFAWKANDYFNDASEYNPLLHTWSLAVEEQFYIFFPIVILLMRRSGKPAILGVVALLSVVSLGLAQVMSSIQPTNNFYLLPSRAWEFGIGALLAIGGGTLPARGTRRADLLAGLGLALIVYSILRFDADTPFPSVWTLLPVVGTALIIAFAAPTTLVGRFLSLKPMVWIGLLSYSGYLWHQPLFAFARIRSPGEVSELMLLALSVASFGLAYFSWRFIEAPFRHNKKLFTRRSMFVGATAVSVAFIAFGLAGARTDGFINRFANPAMAADISRSLKGSNGLSGACPGKLPIPDACYHGPKPPTAALWGDSFAMHLTRGLIAANPDLSFVQLTRHTCGPILNLGPIKSGRSKEWTQQCVDFNAGVQAFIEAHPEIKTVILAAAFTQYLPTEGDTGKTALYDGTVHAVDVDLMQTALMGTMDWLASRGITPVLVAPPPMDGYNSALCAARALLLDASTAGCDKTMTNVAHYQDKILDLMARIGQKYTVYYPGQMLCDKEKCLSASEDRRLYYVDRGHLTTDGSLLAMKNFKLGALPAPSGQN